jgi:hypothetical protein
MDLQIVLSILMGLGLAAAAGFRVFVPLLALAIAAKAQWIGLDPQLTWLAGTPALVCLSVATVAEIAAYKVPWVDNALDSIATPAAVVAGTLAAASQFGFMSGPGNQGGGELLKWGAAIIAGGGLAGLVQVATVSLRVLSLGLTGGLANPVVGVAESSSAVVLTVAAIVLPVVAGLLVLTALATAILVIWYVRRNRRERATRLALATVRAPVPA